MLPEVWLARLFIIRLVDNLVFVVFSLPSFLVFKDVDSFLGPILG